MSDILKRLYDVLDPHEVPRNPDSPTTIPIPFGLLYSAICEIERLRALAGAVSDGEGFRGLTYGINRRETGSG